MQVVVALSFDSSPVFTCFHEDKMPMSQSRNTCTERSLKVMLASYILLLFGSVPSSFSRATHFDVEIAEGKKTSYQKL